jgi:hypothetical protein
MTNNNTSQVGERLVNLFYAFAVMIMIAGACLSRSNNAQELTVKPLHSPTPLPSAATVDADAAASVAEVVADRQIPKAARNRAVMSWPKKLTGKQLAKVLADAGFRGKSHRTAWAIVMRESGGRPGAFNSNVHTGDKSYGLFQINMIGNLGPSRRAKYDLSSNAALLDPAVSARVAYQMSNHGTNFGAWGLGPSAYRSGAGESTISKYYGKYPGMP